MNILVDKLPNSVEADNTVYLLSTDFRYSLSTILAFEDPQLTNHERVSIMVTNLLANEPPDDVSEELLSKLVWFINAGRESDLSSTGPRVYSFSHDANLIYAGFNQTHHVDLQTVELHWWAFLALFMDLGHETTFCELVALRKRGAEGKLTKEERAVVKSLGNMFKLPSSEAKSEEDANKEAIFYAAVEQARANRLKGK